MNKHRCERSLLRQRQVPIDEAVSPRGPIEDLVIQRNCQICQHAIQNVLIVNIGESVHLRNNFLDEGNGTGRATPTKTSC